MELLLVLIIGVVFLKPEDLSSIAKFLGNAWRLKENFLQALQTTLKKIDLHEK